VIGKVIHNLLANDTAVAAEVAEKIFPVIVPQNETFPAITYETLGDEPMEVKGHQKIADTISVQINVFAANYSKVVTIVKAVKGVLDFKHDFINNDIHVCSITPETAMDGIYDKEENLYHKILKYEISVNQPYTL